MVNLLSVRLIAGQPPQRDVLSLARWGFYLLKAQVAETDFLKRYISRLKGPVILGGDLNAPPSALVIRALREVADDAYLASHVFGRPTFRVRAPLRRLDYLLSSKDAPCVEARRIDVEVSDHFPVYAEFRVSGRAGEHVAAASETNRK